MAEKLPRGARCVGGESHLGRRQWEWATRDFDSRQLQAASVVAHRWKWHDRAIFAAARSGDREDLVIRFPVLHKPLVQGHAQSFDVGESLNVWCDQTRERIYARRGIASRRRRSDAAHARYGLTARRLQGNVSSHSAILAIRNNIQFGTSHLRKLLVQHQNSPVLAAAAYNAGSHRVTRWLPRSRSLPADMWVETIPFAETRNYVKNVLAYTVVYDYRLRRPARQLLDRMGTVGPAAKLTASHP